MSEYKEGDRVTALKPGYPIGQTEEVEITKVVMNGHGGDYYYRAGERTLMEYEIIGLAQATAQETDTDEPDPVNHPSHYGGDTTYEAIKVITAWELGFDLGNVTKYVARAGKKDPSKELEDLRKARFYLEHRINQLEQK